MINPADIRQFAKQVVENIARYGDVDYARAEDRFRGSLVPEGLKEAPDYYLHETPYYWAMYILTGDRNSAQFPPTITADPHGAALSWDEVTSVLGTTALPTRSISWRGKAECPQVAWIITDLDGPRNKLKRPDRLIGDTLLLSDEKVDPATKRMLDSKCRFLLHIFRRLGGKPVRYTSLGVGKVMGYHSDADYPHWRIKLHLQIQHEKPGNR